MLFPTWGEGNTAASDIRNREHALECHVSAVIGAMPFLWLPIEDEAGPESRRGYVEYQVRTCSALATDDEGLSVILAVPDSL
jgi:hypothetical protein